MRSELEFVFYEEVLCVCNIEFGRKNNMFFVDEEEDDRVLHYWQLVVLMVKS